MKERSSNVIQVTRKSEDTLPLPQIPQLYLIVIAPTDEERLRGVEVHAAYGA